MEPISGIAGLLATSIYSYVDHAVRDKQDMPTEVWKRRRSKHGWLTSGYRFLGVAHESDADAEHC